MVQDNRPDIYPPLVDDEDWNSLLDHSLEKAAEYIVRKNGSDYEAIQGGGTSGVGQIDYSGTNAATVINNAIGALPARDDTMATVVLKGDITITDSIELDAFTRLVILGSITGSGSGYDMITLSSTSEYYVEICGGGLIHGNNNADRGIYLHCTSCGNESYRSFIHDLTIARCESDGMYIEGGLRVLASNINMYLNDGYGLRVGSYDSKITNVVVGESGSHGIFNDGTNNYFGVCKSWGSSGAGFYSGQPRAAFVGCCAQENDSHGFDIQNNNTALAGCAGDRNSLAVGGVNHNFNIGASHVTLAGCQSYVFAGNQTEDALHIESSADDVRVSSFTTDGNHQGMDIYVHPSATNISISEIAGEYQTDTGGWSDPSVAAVSPWEGRMVKQYNSGQSPEVRIVIYGNDGDWHEV